MDPAAETLPALYAVTGRPVLHSRSPELYNAAFGDAGIDAVYTRLAAGSAAEALRVAREIGIAGLSVTAPFKAEVLPLLDECADDARALGAVNTVVLQDGVAVGSDTDPDGVRAMLREEGIAVRGTRAVLLGAGGAARAAAHALAIAGAAEVTFVNRTPENGRAAADDLGGRFVPWGEAARALRGAELLISCVPPDVDHVRGAWLPAGLPVLDACYVRSAIAARGLAEGWDYRGGGLEWLLGQAHASYRAFTGEEPPAEAMTRALAGFRRRRRPLHVALYGTMGAGKTAAGAALSAEIGYPAVDTDAAVERAAEQTVARIFERDGEVGFRAREALAIRRALDGVPAVLSLGGGALIDPRTRRRVEDEALPVWLWADPETCARRARSDARPLLGADGEAADLEALLPDRLPGYARAAALIVGTVGRDAAGVAARIADELARVWPD